MVSDGEVDRLVAAIFSASADAIVVADASGAIVTASAAVGTLFGYEPDELVGKPIDVILPSRLRDVVLMLGEHGERRTTPRPLGSGLYFMGSARDGRRVPIDVSLKVAEVDGERYVAAFVRDASLRVRAQRQHEAVDEVGKLLLAGATSAETLDVVMSKARSLLDAETAWIVTPGGRGLIVVAADGRGADGLLGEELAEGSDRTALVISSGLCDVVDDLAGSGDAPVAAVNLGLGPAVYVPLGTEEDNCAALVVARGHGARPYDELDVQLVELFTGAVSATFALGGARRELEHLRIMQEHERIADDLHDKIIQRAFAIGMSLQAVRQFAAEPVFERIDEAVHGLDEMIGELRTSIFEVSHRTRRRMLAQSMASVTRDVTHQLGFRPQLQCEVPGDVELPNTVTDDVVTVAREALSNVARHARANNASVSVTLDAGELVLLVRDDGKGISPNRHCGNGLDNMAERARRLGGSFDAVRAEPSGTVLTWRVPVLLAR